MVQALFIVVKESHAVWDAEGGGFGVVVEEHGELGYARDYLGAGMVVVVEVAAGRGEPVVFFSFYPDVLFLTVCARVNCFASITHHLIIHFFKHIFLFFCFTLIVFYSATMRMMMTM